MIFHIFNLIFTILLFTSCTNTQSINSHQLSSEVSVATAKSEIEDVIVHCEKFYQNPAFHYVEGMTDISNVIAVPNKGLYALGAEYTGKGRDGDMHLIHFDSNLQENWRKAYEENSVEWGTQIQYQEDYLYALATRFVNGKGDNDIYVLKTDLEGDKIWSKTSGSTNYDVSNDFAIKDDQIFVSGRTVKIPERKSFLLQTDGMTESMNVIEADGQVFETFVELYADSLLLVSAILEDEARDKWLELTAYDLNLNERWRRKVVDLSGDMPRGEILLTQAGDIYLMGNLGVDDYGYQILIAKVSLQGETEWIKTYGLSNEGQSMKRIDKSSFLLESANHGVIVGGNTGTIYGSGINYIFEINEAGNPLWAKAYKNPNGELSAICYEPYSQQYILSGYYRESLSSDEISEGFLLAVDLNGDIIEN